MALTFTPGQVVAAPDWEALFAQHGGSQSNQIRPPTKAEQEAALAADDDLEQNPIYRYYAADGSYVEARKSPNGDYQVVDYKPSAKFQETQKPSSNPNSPDARNAATLQAQREKNAALPADQDPAYETDEERRKRADARIKEQGAAAKAAEDKARQDAADRVGKPTGNTRQRSENGTTVKETEYLLPDGSKEWRSQTETAQPDRVGKPTGNTRSRNENGQAIKEAEYVLPNGTKEWRTQTAPAETKDAFGVEPSGAPEMTYTVGQMSAGLRAYSQWLSGQVKLHKDTNGAQGVAPNEATKLMERRIALAESALKEQGGLGNVQASQRGQDISQRGQTLQDTQSRRGTAERIATDVNTRGDARLKFLRPENAADHVAARQEEMANALAYASQWGGLRESPEISADSFPALADLRRASMAGIQTAAQGGPRIFDARAVAPPAVPPDPTAAAGAMANPIFRPQPEATAPAAPTVPPAVNPIDQSPIVLPTQLPGAASSGPPVRDDHRLDAGLTPMPPMVPPEQYQPAQPVNMDPSQGPVGMNPPSRFMQETRYGEGSYFDPDLVGNDLSLRLGIDPEIMRQAISGLYG